MSCEHVHVGDACVTICRTPFTYRRRVHYCPTCKTRRRFVVAIPVCYDEEGNETPSYYAPVWTCCGCGDSWSEGSRMQRPFKPRWREPEIAKAKRRWAEA